MKNVELEQGRAALMRHNEKLDALGVQARMYPAVVNPFVERLATEDQAGVELGELFLGAAGTIAAMIANLIQPLRADKSRREAVNYIMGGITDALDATLDNYESLKTNSEALISLQKTTEAFRRKDKR